jgi:hypothetical protein
VGVEVHQLVDLGVTRSVVGEAAEVHDQQSGQRVEKRFQGCLDAGTVLLQLVICTEYRRTSLSGTKKSTDNLPA